MTFYYISFVLSIIISILLAIYFIEKNFGKFFGNILALSYYFTHNILYVLIVTHLSYEYKYVGDGYSPNIENVKYIFIGNDGFITVNKYLRVNYIDSLKIDRIEIIDSLESFTIENKSLVISNKFINNFNIKELPSDSTILYIPKNIRVIKL